MAKLYFNFATMNAGKTTMLLQASYNYRERGMSTMLFVAGHYRRGNSAVISTRIGLEADAGLLGIDEPLVRQAFDGRFDGRIDADFDGGVRSGVNGTPTLFIDGLRYDGPRDLRGLLAALERPVPPVRG